MANKNKEKVYTRECVISVKTETGDLVGTFISWLVEGESFVLKMRVKTGEDKFEYFKVNANDIVDAYMGIPHYGK